jgi:hypothetical protein
LHCLLSSYFLPQTRNATPDSRIETRHPNVCTNGANAFDATRVRSTASCLTFHAAKQ